MIEFSVEIWIARPKSEVFEFVTTARNNPRWNSAVEHIEPVSECDSELGCRYKMIRKLPGGRVENVYEVTELTAGKSFTIKTLSGPTPFTYNYRFRAKDGGTEVILHGKLDPEGLPLRMPSFLGSRLLDRGVESNLGTLKEMMEHGS